MSKKTEGFLLTKTDVTPEEIYWEGPISDPFQIEEMMKTKAGRGQDSRSITLEEMWDGGEALETEPDLPAVYDWTKDPHHLHNVEPTNGATMVMYGPWVGFPGHEGLYASRMVLCQKEGGRGLEWITWEQAYTGHCESGHYFGPDNEDEARQDLRARIEDQMRVMIREAR